MEAIETLSTGSGSEASIDCQPVGTTALGLGLTVTRPIPRN
jgi:hypothetical protein